MAIRRPCCVLWMVSLIPGVAVLVHSLCVAVSVPWEPHCRPNLGWTVALPVLCHFDDGSLSSSGPLCPDPGSLVAYLHLWCLGQGWKSPSAPSLWLLVAFLCTVEMRRVWIHGLEGWGRRTSQGWATGAGQTGRSAHFPGGYGDGGEASFVLRDERGHSRARLDVCGLRDTVGSEQRGCCPYWLNTVCPMRRSMGLICLRAVCPLRESLRSAGFSGSRSMQRRILEGLYAGCFHRGGLPVGIWAGPWGELDGATVSRESWRPDSIPASPQSLPAQWSAPFVSRTALFFWHL